MIIGALFFVGCANKAEEVNVNESVNSTTGLKLNLTWGLAESIIPESIGEYKLESIALYDKNSGESFFFKNKNCTMLKKGEFKEKPCDCPAKNRSFTRIYFRYVEPYKKRFMGTV